MWISDGTHEHGTVQECFVLREIGRDSSGDVIYEGGSVDGITMPGAEALNDEGCFSLVDCVIVEGELKFRQQFHDGGHTTMWRARLSTDGSELTDGRWTDGSVSASVGHFEAKRVRPAEVSKVQIVIGVKDVGAEDGAQQQVQIPAPLLAGARFGNDAMFSDT
jgi:hypothetical protein